jgi:hypothetical protein
MRGRLAQMARMVCWMGWWCACVEAGVAEGHQSALVHRGDPDGEEQPTTVKGRVLNSVTKAPVGRALVNMGQGQYAAMTDDRGQFEFEARERALTREAVRMSQTYVEVRKPGFLQRGQIVSSTYAARSTAGSPSEMTIYLVPEALIVGHVEVPGSEGEVRIECELYRKGAREGQETWARAGTFETWANGEFRFSQLRAGIYKLITHEQMERDALLQIPGAAMFGYPPVYYANTTDFSAATPIAVKAGETAQVNLTVARKEYFPVQISVRNAPVGRPGEVEVYPMGHHSPGWSLGYDPREQTIEGMLPSGNYTVELGSFGEEGATGILNFSVKGRPSEGSTLVMVPNTSVNVNVREEFQKEQSNFAEAKGLIGDTINGRRLGNLRVILHPLRDDVRNVQQPQAFPALGPDGHALTIENVKPGQYRVEVIAERGYAASVESGGVDLKRQPLVVELGATVAPIEVTLRDDGGEVDGTIEEATGAGEGSEQAGGKPLDRYAYVLPLNGNDVVGALKSYVARNDTFTVPQLAPGDYLVVAVDSQLEQSPIGNEEKMKALQSSGQVIHLEAGAKVSVKVKLITGSEEE